MLLFKMRMYILFTFLSVIMVITCRPKVSFTNSHTRDFTEVMSDQYLQFLSNSSPGYGVHDAVLKIRLDGEEYDVSGLKNNETTDFHKVSRDEFHQYQVDFDLVVTNAAGVQAAPISYVANWEGILEELFEEIVELSFEDSSTIDLELNLIDN